MFWSEVHIGEHNGEDAFFLSDDEVDMIFAVTEFPEEVILRGDEEWVVIIFFIDDIHI